MGKIKVAMDRANAGTALDMAEAIYDLHSQGKEWDEAAAQVVADKALERYQTHIAAGLARVGVHIEPGEVVDSDRVLQIIRDKTGLDVQNLTPEGFGNAVKGAVSGQLSDVLGVSVEGVTDAQSLKAAVLEAAKQAVVSGRENGLVSRAMIERLRVKKDWKVAGVETEEITATRNRIAQKKYRKTHKEVWVGR